MHIENYSFGHIKIDGKNYDHDVIIFPEKVLAPWQRKEGHSLSLDDLKAVIDYKPNVLIIGTGAYGVLKIPNETLEAIKKLHIQCFHMLTFKAYKLFNEYMAKGSNVVGAFHLTC